MTLATDPFLYIPILLEEVHTTGVTLGIDYLDFHIKLVCCLGNGVEHNQHAFVGILNYFKVVFHCSLEL